MEWLDKEIKLFINNEGPFNLYVINCCLKLCLLTPLMLSITLVLILAILNNLFVTEPPLPINVIAPIKVAATTNYSRDLATLAKIYTEESKYNREDDNFNCKLMIFNNLCNRVKIL